MGFAAIRSLQIYTNFFNYTPLCICFAGERQEGAGSRSRAQPSDLYSFALEAILLSVLTYIGRRSDLYRCVHPPAASDDTSNASSQDSHEDCGQVLALSKIIATFAEQKDILLPARLKRAYSSAGLEHLPYKQGVIGSNPIGPTPQKSASREVRPQSNIHLGPIAQLV